MAAHAEKAACAVSATRRASCWLMDEASQQISPVEGSVTAKVEAAKSSLPPMNEGTVVGVNPIRTECLDRKGESAVE